MLMAREHSPPPRHDRLDRVTFAGREAFKSLDVELEQSKGFRKCAGVEFTPPFTAVEWLSSAISQSVEYPGPERQPSPLATGPHVRPSFDPIARADSNVPRSRFV